MQACLSTAAVLLLFLEVLAVLEILFHDLTGVFLLNFSPMIFQNRSDSANHLAHVACHQLQLEAGNKQIFAIKHTSTTTA